MPVVADPFAKGRRLGFRGLSFIPLAFIPLAFLFLVAAPPPAPASESLADLVEGLVPMVVNISTTATSHTAGVEMPQFPQGSPLEPFFKDFFDKLQRNQQARKVTSLGSGFVIDPAGYIVTCNHVIAEADEIHVILQDEASTSLKAKVVGRDPKTDLALLKVEPAHPLPYAKWGDSDKARVGDRVVAIGNPFGLGGTVTSGILSARGRSLDAGPYDAFLQTDAPINKGNSGGPMFNLAGEVIGVNSAIYSPSGGSVGIGFAIPAALAKPVIDQLRKSGHITRGYIGVRIQPVTPDIAETIGLDKPIGALVANVSPGSPAEASGFHAGDVVIRFDGHEIGEMRDLPKIVAATEVGKTVTADLWRKGQRLSLKVTVAELKEEATAKEPEQNHQKDKPESPSAARQFPQLGLALAPMTKALRDQYEIGSEVNGIVVTSVEDGKSASDQGIKAGDVIVEINQEAVSTPAQAATMFDKARQGSRKSVLLLVERDGDLSFIALPIPKS